jgi:hypothetical protein
MESSYAHSLRNALPSLVSLILNAKHHTRALILVDLEAEERRKAIIGDLNDAEKRLRELEREIEALDLEYQPRERRSLRWWLRNHPFFR